ncbi:MAG: hypothetical protein ACOCWA_05715 [Bacteroidota bacterium]
MDRIHVFEAFTELNRKVREEKRIISHQEFESFVREYKVFDDKKDFIEEWWDYRFMKALKFIDLNTSEEEYHEILKEFREEKEKKRLERKMDRIQDASEIQKSIAQIENSDKENPHSEHIKPGNHSQDKHIDDISRESLKNRVSRLVEKLSSLL